MGVDIPIHIEHLRADDDIAYANGVAIPGGFKRVFAPNSSDLTVVVIDIAASRADVTIDVGDTASDRRPYSLRVSGPWLTGMRTEAMIVDMLHIANDAVQEGKTLSAMEVITQLLEGSAKGDRRNAFAVLRPVVVPVRAGWHVTVHLNAGAPPGPVDIWIRTLETRDVG
jgi:hypothetical protein